VHEVHELLCSVGINKAERTPTERREANAKHGSNI
jgi:hypothetical protein